MLIEFKEMKHEGKILFSPIVDHNDNNCYFETKAMAVLYAGLKESGLSANDCSYLSRYIAVMVKGLKCD